MKCACIVQPCATLLMSQEGLLMIPCADAPCLGGCGIAMQREAAVMLHRDSVLATWSQPVDRIWKWGQHLSVPPLACQ